MPHRRATLREGREPLGKGRGMRRAVMRPRVLWLGLAAMLVGGSARAQAPGPDAAKWAIVIGVQQYSPRTGFAPLRYAEKDAQAFHDLLVDPQRGAYDEGRVRLFTTGAGDPDGQPTRGNILGTLELLASWARADGHHAPDTVVVYFSGHGVEQDGHSYLIPSDAARTDLANTALSLELVREKLALTGAKKQIVIVDACRFESVPGKAGGEQQSVDFAKALEEFARAQGRVVLASCSSNQASYEDEERGHSAFTGILLDGLLGAADRDGNGMITLTESYEYLTRELRSWAEKRGIVQYPSLYGEITLTLPLVRCPKWAELRISSVPDEAEIWIDGENTGQKTPHTLKLPVGAGQARTLAVRLKKQGYQDLTREVTLKAEEEKPLLVGLKEAPAPLDTEGTPSVVVPGGRPWDVAPVWRERAEEEERRKDRELRFRWWGVGWTHGVAWDGSQSWGHEMNAWARDPLGIDNIETITVTDPTGKVHRAPGDDEYHEQTGDVLLVEYVERFPEAPGFSGLYTFTVTNKQGTSASESVALPPFVSVPVTVATYPPDRGVIEETVPTFSWDPVPEPAHLAWISLHEQKGDEWDDVWAFGGPGTWKMLRDRTSIAYNCDGTARQPELARGRTYRLGLATIVHLGEHAGATSSREIIFTVAPGPNAPQVYDCGVAWRHWVRWDGSESWGHAAHFCVEDALGLDNIDTITVIDPTGRAHEGPGTRFDVESQDEHGGCIAWEEHLAGPPRFSGTYTFAASNHQGKSSVPRYEDAAPFTDEFLPTIVYPPNQAVIPETLPTFSWDLIARPGWLNRIRVVDVTSGGEEGVWEAEEPFGKGEAGLSLTYNFDGTASQPELIPGHSYVLGLEVHHYFPEGGGVETWRWVRFTISPPDA